MRAALHLDRGLDDPEHRLHFYYREQKSKYDKKPKAIFTERCANLNQCPFLQ